MSRKIVINNFEPGMRITDFYVIRKLELKSYDGKPYLNLEIGDNSGRIKASFWGENVAEVRKKLSIGNVVKLQGSVIERNDVNFLKIDRIRMAKADEFDKTEILASGTHHPEDLLSMWIRRSKTIDDKFLNLVFDKIIDDKPFIERMKFAPGGKLWHHAFIGGLLEHMLSVERICRLMAKLYPLCNKDLIIAGALLHDIGKVEELSTEKLYSDYTVDGRLKGHIILGHDKLCSIMDEIPEFPKDTRDHLEHLILSHHGNPELGSPVKPLTLEASILHHADMMDSQAGAFRRIINREKKHASDFSKWVNLAERYLYLKPYQEDN